MFGKTVHLAATATARGPLVAKCSITASCKEQKYNFEQEVKKQSKQIKGYYLLFFFFFGK